MSRLNAILKRVAFSSLVGVLTAVFSHACAGESTPSLATTGGAGVFTSSARVHAGDIVTFFVVVPGDTPAGATCSLYIGRQSEPIWQQRITNSPKLMSVTQRMKVKGAYTALLRIDNILVKGCEISVDEAWFSDTLRGVGGPLIGMFIALAAFFVKDWHSRQRLKRRLRFALVRVLDEFESAVRRNSDWQAPGWMRPEHYSDASDLLSSRGIVKPVDEMLSLSKQWRARTMRSETLLERLSEIRKVL